MKKETLDQIIEDHSQSKTIYGCRQQVIVSENFEPLCDSILSEINNIKFYTAIYECDGVEHVEVISASSESKAFLYLSEIAKKCGSVISELNINMPGNIIHCGGKI